MIQRDYKLVKDDFKVIEGKKELNKQVLLQTFREFCNNNVVTPEDKKNFDKSAMAIALCYASSGKKLIWNIRVYETLGLDRNKILNQDNVEERYLELYNQKLNAYNLSIDEKFTKKELFELTSIDPDYERKRVYK